MSVKHFTIPQSVADGITVQNLTIWRDCLQKELDEHFEKGKWLHTADIGKNREYIYACNLIIGAFSGPDND